MLAACRARVQDAHLGWQPPRTGGRHRAASVQGPSHLYDALYGVRIQPSLTPLAQARRTAASRDDVHSCRPPSRSHRQPNRVSRRCMPDLPLSAHPEMHQLRERPGHHQRWLPHHCRHLRLLLPHSLPRAVDHETRDLPRARLRLGVLRAFPRHPAAPERPRPIAAMKHRSI